MKSSIFFFAFLLFFNYVDAQINVYADIYMAPNYQAAQRPDQRIGIGGQQGFRIELIHNDLGRMTRISDVTSESLNGSRVFFRVPRFNEQYYLKLGYRIPGTNRSISFTERFTVRQGNRNYNIGSFIYVQDQQRWFNLNEL